MRSHKTLNPRAHGMSQPRPKLLDQVPTFNNAHTQSNTTQHGGSSKPLWTPCDTSDAQGNSTHKDQPCSLLLLCPVCPGERQPDAHGTHCAWRVAYSHDTAIAIRWDNIGRRIVQDRHLTLIGTAYGLAQTGAATLRPHRMAVVLQSTPLQPQQTTPLAA